MLTNAEIREMLAKVAEERGWPGTARNLREDNVFCARIEIGNVYAAVRVAYDLAGGAQWKYISTLPDDYDSALDILLWNDCNGVHYESLFGSQFGSWEKWKMSRAVLGWTLWRPVPRPSDHEKAMAERITGELPVRE